MGSPAWGFERNRRLPEERVCEAALKERARGRGACGESAAGSRRGARAAQVPRAGLALSAAARSAAGFRGGGEELSSPGPEEGASAWRVCACVRTPYFLISV